jgi:EAL domain-containing protein (putative c-di-GMP-specific phosphodiesterase class I)
MAIVRLRASDLKHAIESDALSLHYQPQVHAPSGKLVGVEAFVRWPHPAHGMIGPSDIVGLVDEGALHVAFDRWVLNAICVQAARWKRAHFDVPVVAANLWARTLRSPDALRLMDALAATGVDPRMIELECPRGSAGAPKIAKVLASIAALGVRLACEDIAVATTKETVPFDTFKIPYPTSRDVAANASAIASVVRRAAGSGARVVADSVETAEQEDALVQLGVQIVQGRLYGPEVAPEELRTLLTARAE